MRNIPSVIAFSEAFIVRQCQLFSEYHENLKYIYPESVSKWLKFEGKIKRPNSSRHKEMSVYERECETPSDLDY